MFAAVKIPSRDIVACFIRDRHSLLFRKREAAGRLGTSAPTLVQNARRIDVIKKLIGLEKTGANLLG
jgi:hypothetical protein